MKIIKSSRELKKSLKWLTPNRYEWLKFATKQRILDELDARRLAYFEIENQEYDSIDMKFLFSENNLSSDNDQNDNSTYGVKPISASEVIYEGTKLANHDPDIWSKNNKEYLKVGKDEDIWINLPLSYMRDSDIKKEIDRVLKQLREHIPEPREFNIEPRITRLREGGIFEYLDINIWLKINSELFVESNEIISGVIYDHVNTEGLYLLPKKRKKPKEEIYEANNRSYTAKDLFELKQSANEYLSIEFIDKLNFNLKVHS
jgi:hypothetical protein